jgi:hypothetical protein
MAQRGQGHGCGGRMRELVAKPELCFADRGRYRFERRSGEAKTAETAVEQARRVVLAVRENVAGNEQPEPFEHRLREGIAVVYFAGFVQEAQHAVAVSLR